MPFSHVILTAKLRLYYLLNKKQVSELTETEVNILYNLAIDPIIIKFLETQKKIREA